MSRPKKEPVMEEFNCMNCGKFVRRPSKKSWFQVGRQNKYCSRECSQVNSGRHFKLLD